MPLPLLCRFRQPGAHPLHLYEIVGARRIKQELGIAAASVYGWYGPFADGRVPSSNEE